AIINDEEAIQIMMKNSYFLNTIFDTSYLIIPKYKQEYSKDKFPRLTNSKIVEEYSINKVGDDFEFMIISSMGRENVIYHKNIDIVFIRKVNPYHSPNLLLRKDLRLFDDNVEYKIEDYNKDIIFDDLLTTTDQSNTFNQSVIPAKIRLVAKDKDVVYQLAYVILLEYGKNIIFKGDGEMLEPKTKINKQKVTTARPKTKMNPIQVLPKKNLYDQSLLNPLRLNTVKGYSDNNKFNSWVDKQISYLQSLSLEEKLAVFEWVRSSTQFRTDTIKAGTADLENKREYSEDYISKLADILNNILDKSPPLEQDIIVYRGISVQGTPWDDAIPGELISYENFQSTTTDPLIATDFIKFRTGSDEVNIGEYKRSVLRISVPKGIKCLYVSTLVNDNVHEIIFPPFCSFYVDKIQVEVIDSGNKMFGLNSGNPNKYEIIDCIVDSNTCHSISSNEILLSDDIVLFENSVKECIEETKIDPRDYGLTERSEYTDFDLRVDNIETYDGYPVFGASASGVLFINNNEILTLVREEGGLFTDADAPKVLSIPGGGLGSIRTTVDALGEWKY
ncbi:MAG: hypothetical protein ACXWE7_13795, partial [Nitrososphaeraceae archaeon]